MYLKPYLTALSIVPAVFGLNSSRPQQSTDPFQVFTLTADNITAKFIPYGARLTSLLVPDRNGTPQDVIVGYDNPRQYLHDTETNHTYFGAVIGRIANRIKNGTFTLDGTEYHIPKNQNGLYTLHGGTIGYDQRNWSVAAYTSSSVTFTLYDAASEGFPGDVITHATFTVDSHQGIPRLTTKLVSLSLTETTPIMLSNHIYWNLNGFQEPTVLNDTWLQLPLSERFIATDSIQVPNGTISTVADSNHHSMDFTTGKIIGQDMQYTEGLCGTDCVGYDNCFIIDRDPLYSAADAMVPALRINSTTTGISMEVATNQPAVQFFTCLNMDGSIPVKASQVERNRKDGKEGVEFVEKYGCVAIEPEGWIDGVNNPQWGQSSRLFYSPESRPAVNLATYTFGTVDEA
ncbi:aldose epimerase family protein [Aspergillus ibericus CBS 121593]|uniref:Galactose mutarotase-like protein n=1 Tax=Aspergillus ibericus CBS 121593 TaxID=1448316 RepID=A0A395H7I9_9EURO|nr:galactose mutarotase-like protein [Aspergillus ibericus CBS 121593]RAL03125.1 galactose mutarotase-like protein [Aspergillus ibericus CBS 121593]